ncbi:MAG: putative porin [Sedimentisphaerales bacterium]|nr:putative porin [Sedimentisphaerales bacterium]
MKKGIVLAVCLLTLAFGGGLRADDISELKQQVDLLQQKIEQLEAKQNQQGELMESQIAKAVDEKQISALPDSLKWAENIKWSGDFRYRHESINDDTATAKRNRNRIRARLKMEAKINDEWDGVFRLASGSSDSPTSTNQTLGDGASDSFSSKEIWLDWAYADYHPAWKPGLNILLGKMATPFYTVGKNQLIYDGDLSPEGGAAIYKWDVDNETSAQLTGGAFWIRERGTDVDTSLFGVQGLLKRELSDDRHVLGGVSYYDFSNIKGEALAGIGANGNTMTSGVYSNDYNLVEGFGEYGFNVGEVPAAVFGSYVKNIAAETNGDTAWLIGAKYNKAKKPGSWELSYNYRDVEADAVVGGLCDSDFIGGGTDGKGHVVGLKYQLAKNLQLGLNYFMNEQNSSTTKDDFDLFQADLVFKF